MKGEYKIDGRMGRQHPGGNVPGRFIECCCTSLHEALQAQEGGASRIELCENLELGGVTPRIELVESVLANCSIPVNVLIRSRAGDFVYDEDEIGEMIEDIVRYRKLGINGVVIGALCKDGNVDLKAMKCLIEAARPLLVTFHRAFDVCSDPQKAFEDIISLGCERLLTSGHESNALDGSALIADLVRKAGSRITIMAGCGIRPSNILQIESITHAPEYHSSSHGPAGITEASVVAGLVGY